MNLHDLMMEIKNNPETILQDDCIFQLRAFVRGFVLAKGISEDRKLLDSVDLKIKNSYSISPNKQISVEEVLDDFEGKNAFNKYIELWFKYAQH